MDKKMLKIIGIVAGVFVVFIILLFIIAACSKKRFEFVKFQDEMIAAAKNYYKNNEKELPNEDGKTKKVTLKQLINDGYLQEPSKTYKDETLQCDGSITVTNNGGTYLYSPSLTCGKDHRTQLFKDKVLDDSLVTEGVGLYETKINYITTEEDVTNPKYKDAYVFRGEVTNNYVKINGTDKLFRIIRINEDGTIRLIATESEEGTEWDNRYNYEQDEKIGINEYIYKDINSRMKDSIANYYNNSTLMPDSIKPYIVSQGLCLGKRGADDSTKDGSTECTVGLLNQKLGLLSAYEYLNASLDEHCLTTTDESCSNYNWMTSIKYVWTQTAFNGDTYSVWYVGVNNLRKTTAEGQNEWNVVFNISEKVTYVSGTGTKEDPYIIK
ncbi:MAG: hypothetical protein IKP76_02315 [Bacilli bacterium]|nr:hypothetical protein [Bacilli bacterium]